MASVESWCMWLSTFAPGAHSVIWIEKSIGSDAVSVVMIGVITLLKGSGTFIPFLASYLKNIFSSFLVVVSSFYFIFCVYGCFH